MDVWRLRRWPPVSWTHLLRQTTKEHCTPDDATWKRDWIIIQVFEQLVSLIILGINQARAPTVPRKESDFIMASITDLARKMRRGIEKAVAPGSNLSYAQSGEDLVLDFLTNYKPSGFYVDVGCNHPVRQSNSFRFYRKGWSGVVIDANPVFRTKFQRMRPRDRFVEACVSDAVAEVNFHVFEGDALSSISGRPLYYDPEKYGIKRVDRLISEHSRKY